MFERQRGHFFFFFANLIISQIRITCQISSRVNTGYKLPQQRKKMKEYLPTVLLLRDKYKNEMKEFLFWMIYLSIKYENITPSPKREAFKKYSNSSF